MRAFDYHFGIEEEFFRAEALRQILDWLQEATIARPGHVPPECPR